MHNLKYFSKITVTDLPQNLPYCLENFEDHLIQETGQCMVIM